MHCPKSAKLVHLFIFCKPKNREDIRSVLANSSNINKLCEKWQPQSASKVHQTCLLFFYLVSMHLVHGQESANISSRFTTWCVNKQMNLAKLYFVWACLSLMPNESQNLSKWRLRWKLVFGEPTLRSTLGIDIISEIFSGFREYKMIFFPNSETYFENNTLWCRQLSSWNILWKNVRF